METNVKEEEKATRADRAIYTGKTHTIGDRSGGVSRSTDRRLDIRFSSPGSIGNGTNPEQLFAAGWSACFMGAMKIAAGKMKVKFPVDAEIDAEVDLLQEDEEYSLQARLHVTLPGVNNEVAKAIADAAHQICPYSKTIQGNIKVTITIATPEQ